MEPAATSIQVLLQAAEFLERRERGAAGARYPAEAEHGYASRGIASSRGTGSDHRGGGFSRRSVHNALEKHRYRGSGGGGFEVQELKAQRAKDHLRNRQRSLQQRLEMLLSPTGGERARADSLDSSQLSEPGDLPPRHPEDVEIEVDGAVFGGDLQPSFGTRRDHSYSSPHSPAS
ncbi:MAD3 protein, partial [Cepphus grylle]|nr:MAD3 protein [Cepphus grylle]